MPNAKEVMGQMKKGLYNASEDEKIRMPKQSAQSNTGTGRTSSETRNRQS